MIIKKLSLVLILSYILTGCNEKPTTKTEVQKENSTNSQLDQLDAALNKFNNTLQTFRVPTSSSSIVKGIEGTIISVDPNNLETQTGNSLGDSITIELIEMTTKKSLLLNNAQTVSNGKLLESGGAYYLNMKSSGHQLQIKEGKMIPVEFPQLINKRMDLFTGNKDSLGVINWNETDQSFVSKVSSVEESAPFTYSTDLFEDEIESQIELKEPTKPIEAKPEDNRLIFLDVEEGDLPELQPFNKVVFRVKDDCKFDPNDTIHFWYSADIVNSKIEGEYVITLIGVTAKGNEIKKVYDVQPAFEGKDLKLAMIDYEKKYADYLETKKAIEKEKALAIKRRKEQQSD